MTAIFIGLGVVVGIIAWLSWESKHAPIGYEDETGFHYGVKK